MQVAVDAMQLSPSPWARFLETPPFHSVRPIPFLAMCPGLAHLVRQQSTIASQPWSPERTWTGWAFARRSQSSSPLAFERKHRLVRFRIETTKIVLYLLLSCWCRASCLTTSTLPYPGANPALTIIDVNNWSRLPLRLSILGEIVGTFLDHGGESRRWAELPIDTVTLSSRRISHSNVNRTYLDALDDRSVINLLVSLHDAESDRACGGKIEFLHVILPHLF